MQKCLEEKQLHIVGLAETRRNVDHPVTLLHPHYNWIGKDRNNRSGGGIGIMYNTKSVTILDDNLLNSKTDDFERLWVSVKVEKMSMAVGVTYFPVDNVTSTKDNATYLQNELLENIGLLQHKFSNVLLLGDFNGKAAPFRNPEKASSNGNLIDNLVDATDMVLLNATDKCEGKVTWMRGVQQSTIDYAVCSQDLYPNVKSMLVDEGHDYSLGSDHNFLIIDLVTPSNNTANPESVPLSKWNIRHDTNWEEYMDAIRSQFDSWSANVYSNVDDMWTDFRTRILAAGHATIGLKQYNTKKAFWDKEVNKLIENRKQANRLFRIWSKHPQCSPELLSLLWDDYQEKKKRVADKVKSNQIKNKTKVIMDNASKASKNPKAFWNMLSRFNKSSGYPLRIRHPQHPDIIIDDPLIIKKTLTSYWEGLGNNNTSANDYQDKLTQLKTEFPSPDALSSIVINEEFVKQAISKLRNGKATGKDSIPGEFLKHGGNILQNALLGMFSRIKLLEQLPSEWFEGIVKPIHKDGSKECLNNYRGITISSILYKVLVIIMEDQIMKYAEAKHIFGEYQGAFRKNRRCEDHLFALKGICSIRKSNKNKTYLAFLDISKAFDCLDRDKMFIHIWNLGIQGKAWNLIRMLYARVDNKVIFGPFESETYQVTRGVKQGCVLSPCLFNMVIAELDNMLSEQAGVEIGNISIKGLYYADDIVLFAKNDDALQSMLHIADLFAKSWGLSFNSKKSQVLIVGKKVSDKDWFLGSNVIKETQTYKYLGIIITRQLKDNQHINSHLATKIKNLDAYTRYTLSKHMDINRINFGDTIWRSAVQPSLSHAASIWFNNTTQSTKKLLSMQYRMARAVLKLKCTPSMYSTFGELGWLPITEHLNIIRIGYYTHLLNMPEHRLTKIVFNELRCLHNKGKPTAFNYFETMKSILEEKGVDYMFNDQERCNINTFKKFTYAGYCDNFSKQIHSLPSLKYYRLMKENSFRSGYTLSKAAFKNIQLKFKMRNGVSGLGEDLFRQKRGTGLCKHCGKFETLKHFMFQCEAYNSERSILYSKLKTLCDANVFNIMLQNHDFALHILLGDHDDAFNEHFLHFIGGAWSVRDQL